MQPLGKGGIKRWKIHLWYIEISEKKERPQRRYSNVIWNTGCGTCKIDNSYHWFYRRVTVDFEGWVVVEQNGDGIPYWGVKGSVERMWSLALARIHIVPPYPQGIRSKTFSGCLKPVIVPNPLLCYSCTYIPYDKV